MEHFSIIEDKETGKKFYAKPYWLDPSQKWTLYAEYVENKEPEFTECGLGMNEYRDEVNIVGSYKTEKVSVNKGRLTFKK